MLHYVRPATDLFLQEDKPSVKLSFFKLYCVPLEVAYFALYTNTKVGWLTEDLAIPIVMIGRWNRQQGLFWKKILASRSPPHLARFTTGVANLPLQPSMAGDIPLVRLFQASAESR